MKVNSSNGIALGARNSSDDSRVAPATSSCCPRKYSSRRLWMQAGEHERRLFAGESVDIERRRREPSLRRPAPSCVSSHGSDLDRRRRSRTRWHAGRSCAEIRSSQCRHIAVPSPRTMTASGSSTFTSAAVARPSSRPGVRVNRGRAPTSPRSASVRSRGSPSFAVAPRRCGPS